MMGTILIQPIGGAFDADAVMRFAETLPYGARDAVDPEVVLLTDSYEQLEWACDRRQRDPSRFSWSVSLLRIGAPGILLTPVEEGRAATRQFLQWLMHRYEVRFTDDDMQDITDRVRDDFDTLFPPLEPARSEPPKVVDHREHVDGIMEFPIGATLCDGTFEITRELRGTPQRGMYLGRERLSGRELLITVGGPQSVSLDMLRAKLSLRVDGITPLRYIGELETTEPFVAMVEDAPRGVPAAAALSLPLAPDAAARLVLEVASVLANAPRALVGLRPELIFVEGGTLTGIAPRCEPFHTTMKPPRSQGVPPCFDTFYLAPEVLIRPQDEARPEADVFSLAAILAHWVIGHHPFEGEGTMQGLSIAANRRRPCILPHQLADLIESGLSPDPYQRPDVDEWTDSLRRVLER